MRIALVGAEGQLGHDLRAALPGDVVPLGHAEVELTRAESVFAALDAAAPGCVVNAAAYNLVDLAEDEPERAFAVNAIGPRNLAAWCRRADVPLMHFSTDYVFSGTRFAGPPRPFTEDDPPDPQGAYAVSKLAGEHFVRAVCEQHFVLRTCGLYGRRRSAAKGNFVETMLRLGRERAQSGEPLSVVDDHVCTPTFTADLAQAAARLIETTAWGLYHATNGGRTTWRRFAEEIFRLSGIAVNVVSISSAERPSKAPRPRYSALDGTRLETAIGWAFPPWEDALARYLASVEP